MTDIPLEVAERIVEYRGELVPLGNNWFRDAGSGVCYGLEIVDGSASVYTVRRSKDRRSLYTTIKCVQCGSERVIMRGGKKTIKCVRCQKFWRTCGRFRRGKEGSNNR